MKPASGLPKRAIKDTRFQLALKGIIRTLLLQKKKKNGSHTEYLNALIKADGLM